MGKLKKWHKRKKAVRIKFGLNGNPKLFSQLWTSVVKQEPTHRHEAFHQTSLILNQIYALLYFQMFTLFTCFISINLLCWLSLYLDVLHWQHWREHCMPNLQ